MKMIRITLFQGRNEDDPPLPGFYVLREATGGAYVIYRIAEPDELQRLAGAEGLEYMAGLHDLRILAGDIRALALKTPEKAAELITIGDRLDRTVDRLRSPAQPGEDPGTPET